MNQNAKYADPKKKAYLEIQIVYMYKVTIFTHVRKY